MADYKVSVDVDVNDSDSKLNELEKTIKALDDNKSIEINIDTSAANKQINALKKDIKSLANVKVKIDSFGGASTGMASTKKQVDAVVAQYEKLLSLQGKINSLSNKMGNLNGSDLTKAQAQLQEYMATYDKLYATVSKKLNTEQLSSLNKAASSSISAVKQTTNAWTELQRVTKDVGSISSKLAKLDGNVNANQIKELTRQLNDAKEASDSLRKSLSGQLSTSQYQQLNTELAKTENKIKEVEAKIADTRNNLANKIGVKYETSGFTKDFATVNENVSRLGDRAENVAKANAQLTSSYRELKTAYTSYIEAQKQDSLTDEHINNLINANEKYETSLQKVTNQIQVQAKIQKQYSSAEKETLASIKLEQRASLLSDKMGAWLTTNSAAAKKFGAQIKVLQTQLQSCNAVQFNDINNQFQKIQLSAKQAGLTGLSFADKLKQQFSKLGSYFSAATIMMAGMQAGRQAFQNVLDVDTKMTELKRVTDLSADQYADVYDQLTASAQKYGATLTDLISQTADWSRAGFSDPKQAAGLAEITSIYQHIADLDADTSMENILTAYKGFESQLKETYGNDASAAAMHIADVYNEIDNNYATTAADIGEAVKRSASALSLAGNSLEETAGMVTAINEVVQDPEKAGNALKVVSMRLRGKQLLCLRTRKVCTLCYALNCKNIEDSYIRQSARVA